MTKETLFIAIFILCFSIAKTQNDTILLKEVTVNSSRVSIKESQILLPLQIIDKTSINSFQCSDISTLIKQNSVVDIRQRSFASVQSDLSIRGGNFDQSIVLLNGINFSDPQTGHHNLNLPLNPTIIEAIEIIYGPSSIIFGANALTGAINLITKIPEKSALNLKLGYGSFSTFNGELVLNHVTTKFKQSINLNYSKSSGYSNNTDFSNLNTYYENNFGINKLRVKTMLGFLSKSFGANSFYSPKYIDQFEKINSGFSAIKLSGGSNLLWEYKLYYKALYDEFQLFREGYNFYQHINNLWINLNTKDTINWYNNHNKHLTKLVGTSFNLEKKWAFGKTGVGAEFRYENIFSNVLGNNKNLNSLIFSKYDYRKNFTVFAEHIFIKNRIILNVGALAFYNKKYSFNFNYGLDAGYKFFENFILKAGINKSFRLPTFTDLYYSSPDITGNSALIPENAINFETGIKQYLKTNSYINLTAFKRKSYNLIAWVREKPEDKWKTENLTFLDTYGCDFLLKYSDFNKEKFLNSILFSYSYIYQDKKSAGLESKYTLDQVKHKFILTLQHKIYKNIAATWSFNLYKRNGSYLYFDYSLKQYTETKQYDWAKLINLDILAEFKYFSTFLNINNLTNSKYSDLANLPCPGIAFNMGVNIKLSK